MTPEEKIQYHTEVKTAMYEYLENNNLMDVPNIEIMGHLQHMYRHLEEKGLVKFGLTFAFFQEVAHDYFVQGMIRGVE